MTEECCVACDHFVPKQTVLTSLRSLHLKIRSMFLSFSVKGLLRNWFYIDRLFKPLFKMCIFPLKANFAIMS